MIRKYEGHIASLWHGEVILEIKYEYQLNNFGNVGYVDE